LAQKHADDRAHLRFDVDDKNLLIIPHKQRATTVGGKNTPDLHRYDIALHGLNLSHVSRNTSPGWRKSVRLAATAWPSGCLGRLVIQVRPQPAFDFRQGHAFADVIIKDLVASELADGKIF